MRILIIALAVMAAAAWPADDAGSAEETEPSVPAGNLIGYRICPQCHTINPPDASYCMACGAPLGVQGETAWRRTPTTMAPELILWYSSASVGVVTAYDGGRWANELSLAAVYDFDDIEGGSVADKLHFYFTRRRLRPFISIEPYLIITDGNDPRGALSISGGVRYGYGPYGSYVYAGVGAGAYFYEDGVSPRSRINARLLHLFTPHFGIGGSINGLCWSGLTVGPSFAF